MATEAPQAPRCPTCGVELKRTNLSLCAYCGSPLQLGAPATPPDDEVARRLGRLVEHPEFKARLAWNPIDPEAEAPARNLRAAASFLCVAGGLSLASALLRGAAVDGAWMLGSAAAIVVGLIGFAGARAWQSSLRRGPMLRRAAVVLDRRSDTDPARSATTYYFSLRFQDGSEGEFRFPGRGTQYDPMVNGVIGLAFTRGERLVEFHRITG